jgi:hypothetical protein
MQTLRSLADGGRTVVVVTHSVANLGLCDRVLLLAPGGEVAYFGRPEGLLPFFGQENFADVFQSVAADPKGTAERFRATLPGPVSPTPRFANDGGPGHDAHHGQGPGQGQEHERGAGPAAEPRRQQPRVRQAAILGRRQVRVLVADRSYALFTALLPFVMAALVMTVPGAAGFGPPSRPPTGEATQLLVVLIVGAAFMGLAASARDLVGERPIFLRERAVGLAPLGVPVGEARRLRGARRTPVGGPRRPCHARQDAPGRGERARPRGAGDLPGGRPDHLRVGHRRAADLGAGRDDRAGDAPAHRHADGAARPVRRPDPGVRAGGPRAGRVGSRRADGGTPRRRPRSTSMARPDPSRPELPPPLRPPPLPPPPLPPSPPPQSLRPWWRRRRPPTWTISGTTTPGPGGATSRCSCCWARSRPRQRPFGWPARGARGP